MDDVAFCGVCNQPIGAGEECGVVTIHHTSGAAQRAWGPRIVHSDCRDELAAVTQLDLRSAAYHVEWALR